ncbi:MAG: hypothetical protein WCC25_08610 [Candidatus Korobacteraceae bacterium]
MADERKGVIAAGFSLLWRRQGVLWWVFIVSLILGGLGALPATINIGHALNHSLAGQQLTTRFDLGMYIELLRLPEVDITRYDPAVGVSVFLFFLFMLFATGGILETYRQDRRLNTGEFFAASGAFFWRFVRLLLLSIVPFVIVGLIYQGLSKLADHVGDRAIADQVGIFSSLGAVIIFMLLALWIRLWFDLAQVRAVVQNERGMWRNLWSSLRITWHAGIYWKYVAIALVAWVTLAIGLVLWAYVPSSSTPLILVVLELIIFTQLATRLWQLASAMTWYERYAETLVAVLPVIETVLPPVEVIETPVVTDLPPAEPGPELPPADA